MFSCFTDKKFLKRFLKISLPVMLSAFITFLVGFIDNIMVGTVSNEAVSGVYAANQVTFLFDLAIFGLLEGAGIFIQQFMGSKDDEHLKQSFRYKVVLTLIFMLIVMPIVYIFGKYLLYFYSYKDSNCDLIMNEATKYLNVLAISYIPYACGFVYSTSLREIGETKHSMYSSVSAVIINVIFNYIFIIVFKWGVLGAAYATIIARVVEALYAIIISHIKKFNFCFNAFKNFKIEKDLFKAISKKGYLLFINEIGFSVGMVFQNLAFSQRDGVLSSISIVSTVTNILSVLFTGLSTGIGVMVGGCLGADDFKKAKDENTKLNLLGVYLSLALGVIIFAFSPLIPALFTEVNELQKILATKLLKIYSICLWGNCLCVTLYATLKVGGRTKETLMFDSLVMLFVYIPVSWALAIFTSLDIVYIFLIVRMIDILKAMFGIFLVSKDTWLVNLTKYKTDKI